MNLNFKSRFTLTLLASLLCTAVHAQSSGLHGWLRVEPQAPNDFGSFIKSVRTFDQPIYFSGIAGGADGSEGSASVSVDYGVLKLGGHFSGTGQTFAHGQFRDVLTFDVPGQAVGAAIDVTFELIVRGSLQVGAKPGLAQSEWILDASLGQNPALRRSGFLSNQSGDAGSPFGTFSATVRVPNGRASQMQVTLAATAYTVSGPKPTWATFDLGNSLYWGGITSVSAGGVAVGSYALSSVTGTDYRPSMAPVPEPGSAMLLAGGLALLGWRRLKAVRAG